MDLNKAGIKIRYLTTEDKELVNKFFDNLGEDGTKFFNRDNCNRNQWNDFADGKYPDRIYWGAVANNGDGEEVAGIVFLWNNYTKVPWIGIGITEKWKGMHLGRNLMTKASEWAESVGAGGILLTVYTDNIRAQGLYERMGYKRLGNCEDDSFLYLLSFENSDVSL